MPWVPEVKSFLYEYKVFAFGLTLMVLKANRDYFPIQGIML